MWYRVFGSFEVEPAPAGLAAYLHARGLPVEPHFKGDDLGWTEGTLRLPNGGEVLLSRFLTKEDDLRDDLNAHAAELEARDHANSGPLMAKVIQTKQLVTLRATGDDAEDVLEDAARFLAAALDGVYQADGRGWFGAAGELLVPEG